MNPNQQAGYPDPNGNQPPGPIVAGGQPTPPGQGPPPGQQFSGGNQTPPPGQPQPQSGQGPGQTQGQPAKPPVNPNSTQNFLNIAEVRDGIVIMNDGSFRSVIMVKSINFDLMSPQEQEGVEYSYQSFLNSLYFPVQIFIRSQKVDLAPYIQKLDKIRAEHDNMLLALLMDDYLNYIDDLAASTNIMDKRFYVVVPYFPKAETVKKPNSSKNLFDGMFGIFNNSQTHLVIDETKLEDAKTELRNRVQAAMSGLAQCGIQGLPLDTQELIELYYGVYNPETANRQQLKNFDDLTTPVVTKGPGRAAQPNLDKEL